MGQGQSSSDVYHPSREELRYELASKFAKQCFSTIELFSLRKVFKDLADKSHRVLHVEEEAIARFLKIPQILGVSPIIFRIFSYIGAFPFYQDAPVILNFEQIIIAITLITERYQKIMEKSISDRRKLVYYGLAVSDCFEPRLSQEKITLDVENTTILEKEKYSIEPHASTLAKDDAVSKSYERFDDHPTLAALKLLGVSDDHHSVDIPISQTSIPPDDLKRFIMLLILISPNGNLERFSSYVNSSKENNLKRLGRTADSILASFINVEKFPGITFHQFDLVISISLPFILDGLTPLFEKFLFSENSGITTENRTRDSSEIHTETNLDQELLPKYGEILNPDILSQLSFFLPSSVQLHKLRLLYSGNDAGFSMGSFETHVFNWRAPTILLVSGTRIVGSPNSRQERSFNQLLPPKRFPDSEKSSNLVFGVYLSQYWRQSHKACFGDSDTLLFQLEPTHEVFHASSLNNEYVAFNKKNLCTQGITVGCPQPKSIQMSGSPTHVNLGAVSLMLDSGFEFGVFSHNFATGGGAFHKSVTREFDWEDRFEVENLEVWGCGDDNDAEQQRSRWQWEEKEAEARRRINLGSGDVDSDRALLEMAGLINKNMSGGSMN